MKKIYLLSALIGLISQIGYTQPVANDDVTPPINPLAGNFAPYVWQNDTFNGAPITYIFAVDITQISSTHPGVSIVNRFLSIAPDVPPGVYYLTYNLCDAADPTSCDTATVTVNVCFLEPPVITNIVQPDCTTPTASITLENMPVGNWTLYVNNTAIPGSGETYTATGVSPVDGFLTLYVEDASGCRSEMLYPEFIPASHFSLSLSPGEYQDLNLDGIISPGDLMHFGMTLDNTGSCGLSNFSVYSQSDGLMLSDLSSITLASGDSIQIPAYVILTQEMINAQGGNVSAVLVAESQSGDGVFSYGQANFTLDISDGIRLVQFIDSNPNGILDPDENIPFAGQFQYEINNDGVPHQISSCAPIYLYEDNPVTTYTISYLLPEYLAVHLINTQIYTDITIPEGSGITTLYFPLTYVPHEEVAVAMWELNASVPGFDKQIVVRLNHYSNIPGTGTLHFSADPAVSITAISPEIPFTSAGFDYDYSFSSSLFQDFVVTVHIPELPEVSLGQILAFQAFADAPVLDMHPEDNQAEINAGIVGAFDPNDKTENHGPQIRHADFGSDEYLNYTIRFENTGNGNAINVRIEDVLNDQLDATTLRTIAASHDYIMERTGENVIWRFNNIQLPPSIEGTTTGHGYVHFEVKPKPGFAVGDIIPNTAEIYFDTNPAIVTNTFETEFVEELRIADFATNILRIFPNPTNGNLNVSATYIEQVSVFDVSGKLILEESISADEARIDVSRLTSGVYLIQIKTTNGLETKRFIKQ